MGPSENENDLFRCDAVKTPGEIEGISSVKHLLNLLENEDDMIILYTVEALGETGHRAAVEPLMRKLEEKDELIRWKVIEALGKIRNEESIKPLIEILEDEDELILWQAIESLSNFGKSALPYLINAMRNKNWRIRANVIDLIKNIQDKEVLDILIESLNDTYEVRIKAVKAIKEYVIKNMDLEYGSF